MLFRPSWWAVLKQGSTGYPWWEDVVRLQIRLAVCSVWQDGIPIHHAQLIHEKLAWSRGKLGRITQAPFCSIWKRKHRSPALYLPHGDS